MSLALTFGLAALSFIGVATGIVLTTYAANFALALGIFSLGLLCGFAAFAAAGER